MNPRWLRHLVLAAALLAAGCAPALHAQSLHVVAQAAAPAARPRAPDVPYEPSPPEIVKAMLDLAAVTPNDVVYDLGSGDGRIVIAAARDYGARAVGIDIDPQRIAEANENARRAGVTDHVKFVQGDLFEADFTAATVVTLFLWPEVNLKLRPKLLALRPGTRIVSHFHDMGDWKPARTIRLRVSGERRERPIYLWIVPERKAASGPAQR